MSPQTIAVIGALDADLIMITPRIPDRGESVLANEYLEALGGKGANAAISTHRSCHRKPPQTLAFETTDEKPDDGVAAAATNAGGEGNIQVKMIGAVGDDRYGQKFIVELNRNGVDASGVVTMPNTRSSVCFVMVEETTRENRCLFTWGATGTWRKEHFESAEQLGGGVKPDLVVAQMEIKREVVETMIATAGKAGVEFCLNAAPTTPISRHLYRYVTHLLVNESEAAIMSGGEDFREDTWMSIAQGFLKRGVKNVVITLGAKSAFYANAKESGHCPAFDIEVRDTTGAGDPSLGLIRANKAAAMTIQTVGAQDGIPWADEIDAFDAPRRVVLPHRSSSTSAVTSQAGSG
ncbi:hypothetical protein CMUS01_12198 [Colletotrichum musicola]|uniref:Carbohydrate kinase PfkB domain-containing protein n=1 Tax=Colletotrichum musicola TaxID=2175873 RepID=A0A8H6JPP9_9PEZI|nr:hypothetical protein CMUS01_12198 [Colletotrichum musicola]